MKKHDSFFIASCLEQFLYYIFYKREQKWIFIKDKSFVYTIEKSKIFLKKYKKEIHFWVKNEKKK